MCEVLSYMLETVVLLWTSRVIGHYVLLEC